ncbi:hypothetical protein ACFB49_01870 [Sphingomonas sp. DBB INV C78]|uniref:hypothetical protein n=1 Tax=Sphingomonas sp. DBB INV C78 TaxID=3349434 RepID=UPI0036D2452D
MRKISLALGFIAGLVAITPVAAQARGWDDRRDARQDYQRDVREAERDYRRDLRRADSRRDVWEARRDYQRNLREARREHYRDTRGWRGDRRNDGWRDDRYRRDGNYYRGW